MSYLLEKFKMKGKVMEICDRYARNIIASLSTVAHTGNYNDLTNKPTIPSAQVNSDWNANTGVAEILNKPNLSTVATSGSYNDLIDKPTIPTGQVNSDWNATSGVAEILNKPSLSTVATSGNYNDLINKPITDYILLGSGIVSTVDLDIPTTAKEIYGNITVQLPTGDISFDFNILTSILTSSDTYHVAGFYRASTDYAHGVVLINNQKIVRIAYSYNGVIYEGTFTWSFYYK